MHIYVSLGDQGIYFGNENHNFLLQENGYLASLEDTFDTYFDFRTESRYLSVSMFELAWSGEFMMICFPARVDDWSTGNTVQLAGYALTVASSSIIAATACHVSRQAGSVL